MCSKTEALKRDSKLMVELLSYELKRLPAWAFPMDKSGDWD
jgi:hypothetical protein